MVVDPAVGHLLRPACAMAPVPVPRRPLAQQKAQGGRMWKLGCAAEPPNCASNCPESWCTASINGVSRGSPPVGRHVQLAQGVAQRCVLLGDRCTLLAVGTFHLPQQLTKRRQAAAGLWREIGAGENALPGHQASGTASRPARGGVPAAGARSGRSCPGPAVPCGRPLMLTYSVHYRGGVWFERLVGHHVTPADAEIADGQQIGFVLASVRSSQGPSTWPPVDRVGGVLLQVRAGGIAQAGSGM